MSWPAAVLSLIGALAELSGIALVALDIRKDIAQARDLFPPISLTLGVATEMDVAGEIQPGDETLEQTVARLERRLADLRIHELGERLKLRQELLEAVSETATELRRRDLALREELQEALTGSVENRRRGVALFALGAILTCAGSLLG